MSISASAYHFSSITENGSRWTVGPRVKGEAGLATYWREKNVRSIDGLPTGLFEDTPESEGG